VRPMKTNRIWAPALSVVALAFPATAVGAPTRGPRSEPAPGTSGLLAHALRLGPGSGYKSPHGSSPVRVIQRRLALAGHAPGPIDGRFGPMTRRAVVAFQTARGLQADGIVGPLTLAALTHVVPSPGRGEQPGSQTRVPASPPSRGHGGRRQHPTRAGVARPGVAPPGVARPGVARPRVAAPGVASPRVALPVVASPSHRRSAPSRGELLILCVLGLTLIVGAWLYVRRRRANRIATNPHAAVNGSEPATPVRYFDLAGPLASHTANFAATAAPVATSRAPVETNGASTGFWSGAPPGGGSAPADDEAAYRRADQGGEATGAFNLGVLLEERGAVTEAEAAYRRAAKRGHGPAASNLGVLLEERGASAEAEAAYRCADQGGEATGAFNLGVLLEERGAMGEAEAAYRRAAKRGRGEIVDIARGALLDLRDGRQASAASLTPSGGYDA
jgi:peptidoglycan hydrolase-like protein with peptidoglycan-binding domain